MCVSFIVVFEDKRKFVSRVTFLCRSLLLFCGRRQKKAARKQRKTVITGYLALVQNVSRFGAGDSGGDADDDVESVMTSGSK
jgi:hypothetical protein